MKKQLFYFFAIILTILDIAGLIYITLFPANTILKFQIVAFDLILCFIFWIEFIVSLKNSDDKKKFMKNNYLSIFGMLPFNSVFLRALRFVKLAHLIKIFLLLRDNEKSFERFLKKTYLDKIILISIIFIVIVTILVWVFDSNITDFRSAIWYIFASMTSTGYGDIVPVTVTGRFIGIITMVGGIILFSIITAGISSVYVSRLNKDDRDKFESKIEDLTFQVQELNKKIDELKKDK